MNTLSFFRLLSITLLISLAFTTQAQTFLGGEIYAKYIGNFNEGAQGTRQYDVLVKLYKDCESEWRADTDPLYELTVSSQIRNEVLTFTIDSFIINDPIFNCPTNIGDFPNTCRFVEINEKLDCPAVEFCNDIDQLWFRPLDGNGEPVNISLAPASDWVFSVNFTNADSRPLGGINNYNQFLNLDPFLNPFVHFYIENKLNNRSDTVFTGPFGFPAMDTTINDYRSSGIEFTDPNSPAPAFCVGNRYEYKILWEDQDNPNLLPASADDSVAFKFTNVLEGPGGNIIPYVQGFGGGRPFKSTPPIVFDPDGIITFTADEAFMGAVAIKAEKWRWSYYTEFRCLDPNGNCDPNDPTASDSVNLKLRERKLIWETTRDTRFQFPSRCNDSLPLFKAEKTITFSNIIDTITGQPIEFAEFNCADTTLFFEFDRVFVECSSIESGGSDFRIAKGTPQNPSDPQEIEFVTFNCGDDGNSTQITIHLENCIPPGNYILYLDKGKDNNTLVTQCGVSVPQFFSVPIHINTNFEYDYLGPEPIRTCTPSGDAVIKSGVECGTQYFWEITYREDGTNFTLRDTLKDDSLNSSAIIPFNRTNNWASRTSSGPDTNKFDVTVKIGIEVAGGCYDESDPIDVEFTKHAPVDVPNFALCPEEEWPVINMDTVDNNTGGSNQVWKFLYPSLGWTTIDTDTTRLNSEQSGGFQVPIIGPDEFGFLKDTIGSRNVGDYVYQVELNDGQCVVRDTFQIVRENLYVDIVRDTALCENNGVWLQNRAVNIVSSDTALTYLWFLGGDTIKINDTTYADSSAFYADSAGWYILEVTKNKTCFASDTGFFDVAEFLNRPKPKCELITWNGGNIKQVFSWPRLRGADIYEVSFDGQNTWEVANGDNMLSHTTFGKRDGLWVRGKNDEDIDTLTPAPCWIGPAGFAQQCEIVIKPVNVFTPNGDGVNDVLRFDLLEFTVGSTLQVFNRWGKLVYESDNYRNDWDGGDVEAGTYYYILDINDPAFNIRKGTITILR